jgi:hypothetical protein
MYTEQKPLLNNINIILDKVVENGASIGELFSFAKGLLNPSAIVKYGAAGVVVATALIQAINLYDVATLIRTCNIQYYKPENFNVKTTKQYLYS